MKLVAAAAAGAFFWLVCMPVLAEDSGVGAIIAQPVVLPPGASLSEREALLPAKTEIVLAIDEPISSRTAVIGNFFDIRVARPLAIAGRTIIPEGTKGRGQIVHASKKSWGGKAGELIVAARYIDLDGQQIPLRSLRVGGAGSDAVTAAMVMNMAVPLTAFVVSGKDMVVPAGTLATALLREETRIALAPPETGTTTPTPISTGRE